MTKKCHENSGGYALCLLYTCDVRDTTCCCVHMYTVFVALCVAHFPLKE